MPRPNDTRCVVRTTVGTYEITAVKMDAKHWQTRVTLDGRPLSMRAEGSRAHSQQLSGAALSLTKKTVLKDMAARGGQVCRTP